MRSLFTLFSLLMFTCTAWTSILLPLLTSSPGLQSQSYEIAVGFQSLFHSTSIMKEEEEEELNGSEELEIDEQATGTSSSTANDKKRKPQPDTFEPSKKSKQSKEQRKEKKRQKKEVENTGARTSRNGNSYEEDSRTAKKAEKKRLRALVRAGVDDDEDTSGKVEENTQLNRDASAKELKAARKAARKQKAIQSAQSQQSEASDQESNSIKPRISAVSDTKSSSKLNGAKTAHPVKGKTRKLHIKANGKVNGYKTKKNREQDCASDEDVKLLSDIEESKLASETLDTRHGAVKRAEKEKLATPAKALVNDNSKPCTPSVLNSSKYLEAPELSALTQDDIDSFLSESAITVSDPSTSSPLRPMISFSHLPLSTTPFTSTLSSFKSPTPIQSAVWPFLFAGRDVIGVAETGSGKTLAFGVPCIDYINSLPSSSTRPQSKKYLGRAKAVVVAPTRELALQSYEHLSTLGKDVGIQTVCVYGGVAKEPQKLALQSADIIVATPGRLIDLMNEGAADLSKVGYLVLDEADRMLDKGFEDDMRTIISATPSTLPIDGGITERPRQTLMFTATWPPSIRELAATFLTNPVHISIGQDNPKGDLRANTRITQTVEVVEPRAKEYRLLQIIKKHQSGASKDDRILIFCLYKKEAQRVESSLRAKGLRVVGIHGDLSQEKRTKALSEFKREGGTPLLVATDVAARGLDIPDVKLVINLTFPLTVEDYGKFLYLLTLAILT